MLSRIWTLVENHWHRCFLDTKAGIHYFVVFNTPTDLCGSNELQGCHLFLNNLPENELFGVFPLEKQYNTSFHEIHRLNYIFLNSEYYFLSLFMSARLFNSTS